MPIHDRVERACFAREVVRPWTLTWYWRVDCDGVWKTIQHESDSLSVTNRVVDTASRSSPFTTLRFARATNNKGLWSDSRLSEPVTSPFLWQNYKPSLDKHGSSLWTALERIKIGKSHSTSCCSLYASFVLMFYYKLLRYIIKIY